jgi:hypothetical protein
MVIRSIPRESSEVPMSMGDYNDLIGNVDLVSDYEHIPPGLRRVAKKLQIRWPRFADQDVPGRVGEWDVCFRSSTLLRGANGEMENALSANDNAGVDALGDYWKGKVESYMNQTSFSSFNVQRALIIAGLQVLNYKKHTLEVMQDFYHRENTWFHQPSDGDWEHSARDLSSKLELVNKSIVDCTRQMNDANGVLENVKSKLEADVAKFESNNITTWGPDRK